MLYVAEVDDIKHNETTREWNQKNAIYRTSFFAICRLQQRSKIVWACFVFDIVLGNYTISYFHMCVNYKGKYAKDFLRKFFKELHEFKSECILKSTMKNWSKRQLSLPSNQLISQQLTTNSFAQGYPKFALYFQLKPYVTKQRLPAEKLWTPSPFFSRKTVLCSWLFLFLERVRQKATSCALRCWWCCCVEITIKQDFRKNSIICSIHLFR